MVIGCCSRVLLYGKMPKETEEARIFWNIYIIDGIWIGGGAGPLALPGYSYGIVLNVKAAILRSNLEQNVYLFRIVFTKTPMQ